MRMSQTKKDVLMLWLMMRSSWQLQGWCLTKVTIGQDNGSNKSPSVEGNANPGRDNLDPHWTVILPKIFCFSIWSIPVGQGHHDIKRSQGKHKVEKWPGITDSIFLVVPDSTFDVTVPLEGFSFSWKKSGKSLFSNRIQSSGSDAERREGKGNLTVNNRTSK